MVQEEWRNRDLEFQEEDTEYHNDFEDKEEDDIVAYNANGKNQIKELKNSGSLPPSNMRGEKNNFYVKGIFIYFLVSNLKQ